jgi:WD40 repeat protein
MNLSPSINKTGILMFLFLLFNHLAWSQFSGQMHVYAGHTGLVTSVAISPDGKIAISGSEDRTVAVWELKSGRHLRSLIGHKGIVRAVAFSPDGKTALSCADDHTVKWWDLATGRLLRTLVGECKRVNAVVFFPDGKTAFSGGFFYTGNTVTGMIELWDLVTGEKIRTFTGHQYGVEKIAYSPEIDTIYSYSSHEISLWNTATGMIDSFWTEDASRYLAISENGRMAIVFSDSPVFIDIDHNLMKDLEKIGDVSSLALSPDGKTALGASKNVINLWDPGSGKVTKFFSGNSTEPVTAMTFSPDGKTILSGYGGGSLRLWDISTGKETRAFPSRSREICIVTVPKNGAAITGGSDGTLKIWDLATGKKTRSFIGHGDEIISVSCPRDGSFALSGDSSGRIKRWDIGSGKEMNELPCRYDLKNVSIAPDGRKALSSSSWLDEVSLFDVETGKEVQINPIHGELADWTVDALAFTPDCMTAFLGYSTGMIARLDIPSMKIQKTEMSYRGSDSKAISISPDGKTVLSGSSSDTLMLWDAKSGRNLKTLSGHTDEVNSVVFSPNGGMALSGSADNTLRLWDLANGRGVQVFTGHSQAVNSVALASGGGVAVSVSDDSTLRTWDLATGKELMASIADALGEWLTWTPYCYFDGSDQALKNWVYVVNGMETRDLSKNEYEKYHAPEMFKRLP